MAIQTIKKFLALEAASGLILLLMALLANLWVNSPFVSSYIKLSDQLNFVINEGLMTFFFLIVSIELKRGFIEGKLRNKQQVLLPLISGLGGMLVPALLYWLINYAEPSAKGWPIPVATDIAFALGILSLFGQRIPAQLKLFLLLLAIFDDLGAILLIAFLFNTSLNLLFLGCAAVICIVLYQLNRQAVKSLFIYLFFGLILWFCLLKGGIHPTLAGVILALFLPNTSQQAPLYRCEALFHPWVAYFIVPLFALMNAGVPVSISNISSLNSHIVFGTIIGLFVGKQLGVFVFGYILIKSQLATLPEKSSWLMFYGVAILCGIGFTMSLFLGTLSFGDNNHYLIDVRFGVLIGSILSGLFGSLILVTAFAYKRSRWN